MTFTARTRTPGKTLSLAASLTMVIAGVSGIVLAGPVAAEPGKGKGEGQSQGQSQGNGNAGGNENAGGNAGGNENAGGNAGGNENAGGNAGGNDGGAKPGQEVCGPLDSGKIDYSGGSVTVPAPDGFLISGYCVKAGSDQSTSDGAVSYVTITPAASVTFSHYSGKSISHYSVSYIPVVEKCVDGLTGTYGVEKKCDKPPVVIECVEGDGPYDGACTAPPGCIDGETGLFGADQKLCSPTIITEGTPTQTAAESTGSTEATSAGQPGTVNAAQAATVPANAKAPATVAVPAAATVPAAVPAGDGSQVPGLPMWALALVAAGVVGAAAAGRQLVKSN